MESNDETVKCQHSCTFCRRQGSAKERKMNVVEMRSLLGICLVSLFDRIFNENENERYTEWQLLERMPQ